MQLGRRRLRTSDASVAPNTVVCAVDFPALLATHPARAGAMFAEALATAPAACRRGLPATVHPGGHAAEAVRSIAQIRHLGKVVLSLAEPPAVTRETRRLHVRGDRTMLVTGGLGGLGLAVAGRLVERGARHVALVGRRPPGEEATRAIERLTAAGASVTIWQADVAEPAEVARVLGALRTGYPPLGGVIHAAGTLDDGVLAQQTRARLASVFAAKAGGAFHLHRQIHEALDFFVLFSSIASALGSPGQANYAAANGALDGLATLRHGRSGDHAHPTVSLQWGPWDTVGMAARADRHGRALATGFLPMAPAVALDAFEEAVVAGAAQVVIADARWGVVRRALPALAEAWTLSPAIRIDDASRAGGDATVDPIRRAVLAAPAIERAPLAERWLLDVACSITRNQPGSLDPAATLQELGFDSLMAVELRNRIRAAFDETLSLAELLRGVSPRTLSFRLAGEAARTSAASATTATSAGPAPGWPWAARTARRSEARVRLLCFPFAGGGPSVFHDWPRGLPGDVEVVAVQLPGRAARIDEPPRRRMGELVPALSEGLLPLLDRPFAFFGHCMGALVMFEVLRHLRRAGLRLPGHLFVSASPAPGGYLVPALDPRTGRYVSARPDVEHALVPVHALPRDDFFDVLRFLNFGPTRGLLDDPELSRFLLPTVQADFEVCGTYRYTDEEPFDLPLTVFGGASDPFATRAELERWAPQSRRARELLVRPGDHYFLYPERAWLLREIAMRLAISFL